MAAPYLLQKRPDDGRPVALHQALLVHRVVLDEVLHQQQEGGHAVPLQPALCKARVELGATSPPPTRVLPTSATMGPLVTPPQTVLQSVFPPNLTQQKPQLF